MPEKPSLLKQLANPKNAQKSTGPRTEAGKRRSSQNGVRHGLLARSVVLEGGPVPESVEEFEQHLADLKKALGPRDAVEDALVQRIAECLWRQRRATRFEVGSILTRCDEIDAPPVAAGPVTAELDERLKKLQKNLAGEGRMLAVLRDPKTARADELEKLWAYKDLQDAAAHCDPPQADLASPAVYAKALEICRERHAALARQVAECEALRDEAARFDADAPTRNQRELTLPPADRLYRLIRYEGMLDRQLHRALRELRLRRQRKTDDM